MLKISKHSDGDTLVFILEGSLTGPWVHELRSAWVTAIGTRHFPRTKVDLSGVTFVSSEAKELLEWLFVQGVELFSTDILTKSIVKTFARKHS